MKNCFLSAMLNYVLMVLANFCLFTNSAFIEPNEATDTMEVFQYGANDIEFIIYNHAVTWKQASYICRYEVNGTLAFFENQDVIDFVAEYLAESDFLLNTLWINLRSNSSDQDSLKSGIREGMDESIFDCPYHTPSDLCPNCTESRNCEAIVRMFHSNVCFVKLQCDARRKFICRRSITKTTKSTDWIKIGSKLFKIFYERLTYDDAMEACTLHDIKSKLALIETYNEAQTLGRFLLIGRPSKERVWIGGRWEYDSYEYADESVVFSNVTDSSGYPPWLRGSMSRAFGCILLDRHLSNYTYFVESSCKRYHSFMCYKKYESAPFVDVCFVGNYDWRIYYTPKNWFRASVICQNSGPTGRLPYIQSQDLKSIIHVMETSRYDVLYHVWLGAYFKNGWTWTYNNRVLSQESIEGFPPWVVNKTYKYHLEKYNLCLNLDREDSLEAIFYGTHCYYAQFFICQYDQGIICNNITSSTRTTFSMPSISTVTKPPTKLITTVGPITTSSPTTTPITNSPTTATPTTTTPITTTLSTTTKPTTTTPTTTTPTTTTPTITTPTTTTPTTTTPTTTTPTTTTPTTTTPTTTTPTTTTPTTTTPTTTTPTTTTPTTTTPTTTTPTTTTPTTTTPTTTTPTTTTPTTTTPTTTTSTTTTPTTTTPTTTTPTTTTPTTTTPTTTTPTTTTPTTTKSKTTKTKTTTTTQSTATTNTGSIMHTNAFTWNKGKTNAYDVTTNSKSVSPGEQKAYIKVSQTPISKYSAVEFIDPKNRNAPRKAHIINKFHGLTWTTELVWPRDELPDTFGKELGYVYVK